MITVHQLSKAFGGQVVLDEVNLSLAPGHRVGLVGRNGTGKTTFLKILAGLLPADSGTVVLAPGARVGLLGQEGQLAPDRTLYKEMEQVFARVFEIEDELRALENEMADAKGGELDACFNRYAQLQAEYEHAEGHLVDARIRTVLSGMGFRAEDLDRPCREFSGGWQMRGAMARLLLSAPTLLLLDEPTNHLDLAAVEWLEEYLASYPGTVVLVSHDRTFLDRAINRVIELKSGEFEDFRGNYTYYLEEAERRYEAQVAAYQNQQKKLEHDQRFIDRFRYKATLATRVKSREKMVLRRERIDSPEEDSRRMKVSFAPAGTSGRDTIVAKGIWKAYPPIQVLEDISLKVERDDRIALVGPNGAGKSTLLRILAGIEMADRGTVNPGFRLTPVYYAQHQAEALNPNLTVLEELSAAAPAAMDQTHIRTILGCLLFTGDDVYKRIAVLSGGERSRVALARCIVQPSNVLFLDEPTNHLDLSARENLLDALQDYEGSIVFISHDRHFMDGLANKVLALHDRRGTLHLGNYSEYRARVKADEDRLARTVVVRKAEVAPAPKKSAPVPNGRPVVPVKQKRTVKWKIEALEARLFALEEELEKLRVRLADPLFYRDPKGSAQVKARHDQVEREIAALTEEWEAAAAEV
ncbi:MAG: ABC-F family ATP-binding cassette domain-containing protein [Armatimonadetes bacterium]|nr:ABC-F family ATP-binding cassette domain-containing protein [Armatimonadota bacterium]